MKKILLAATAVAFAAPAFASGDEGACPSYPKSEWMKQEDLKAQLEATGLKVRKIKADDGCWEAYVIDSNGNKKENYYDPKTGALVKSKE